MRIPSCFDKLSMRRIGTPLSFPRKRESNFQSHANLTLSLSKGEDTLMLRQAQHEAYRNAAVISANAGIQLPTHANLTLSLSKGIGTPPSFPRKRESNFQSHINLTLSLLKGEDHTLMLRQAQHEAYRNAAVIPAKAGIQLPQQPRVSRKE